MQNTMRWGKIVLCCALALTLFLVWNGRLKEERQRLLEEETTLRINLAGVTAQGNSLDEQIARVGTNSYVESRARQDYQYIKPGELRFEFVNPEELYAYTEEEARIRQEAMED